MERTDRNPDTLNRPEWNSLEHNYDLHDIGERFVRIHCRERDLIPEAWGIDMRDEDDSLIFDDKMDLKVYGCADPDVLTGDLDSAQLSLAGIVEIKTKRSADWFGKINSRHFCKYLHQAHVHDVPTFIYMSLVDEDAETIERDTFIPVNQWDKYGKVLSGEYDFYGPRSAEQFLEDQIGRHPQVEHTFRAPDGNEVVELDAGTGLSWIQFTNALYHEGLGYSVADVRQLAVQNAPTPSSEESVVPQEDNNGTDT